ncbi:MAG: YegS/Rv2252/BmrU family lipid kinase [Gemmatimonadota bacterium]
MPTLLLINPAAGHGRAAGAAAEALDYCGRHWREVRVVTTRGPGDGVNLVKQAIAAGCARVLALGGDGTAHEAANGILSVPLDQRPALGIIPMGTGNDYAKLSRTHGLSVAAAVQALAHGRIARLDVGQALGEYFINSIGIGFDAEVARRVAGYKQLRGIPAYLSAALATFSSFDPPRLSISSSAASFEESVLLLEVGIGAVVGGGFKLTPDARPDDGLFDVCSIARQNFFGFVFKLPLAMLGLHGRLPGVRIFRTDRLTVRSTTGAPLLAQLDGELRPIAGPLEITQLPLALPVLIA